MLIPPPVFCPGRPLPQLNALHADPSGLRALFHSPVLPEDVAVSDSSCSLVYPSHLQLVPRLLQYFQIEMPKGWIESAGRKKMMLEPLPGELLNMLPLCIQVNELKTSMQPLLQEWKIYNKLSDDVNMMTARFEYCVEHSKPVVLSLEALKCQVQNLQVN